MANLSSIVAPRSGTRATFTATAGQTVFSTSYTVGSVDVWLNGIKLVSGTDFTATNGTSITLVTAAALNDTIEVISYGVFSVANAATLTGIETLTNKTLSSCTLDGTNKVGFLAIPQSGVAKTTSYTLATTDIGEFVQVSTGGSIVIPNSTFNAGDVVSVFNNTSASITITCNTTTAYISGMDVTKASVSLATRGIATILFISGTVCVITGNVS